MKTLKRHFVIFCFLFAGKTLLAQGIAPVDTDSDGKLEIATKDNLLYLSQNPSADWSLDYEQTADIIFDDADFQNGGDFYNSGSGFSPIGNSSTGFTGTYDGNGYKISNLYTNRGATDFIGFFGQAGNNAEINNLGIVDAEINGRNFVGGLVGSISNSNISIANSYFSGSINATGSDVGGLIGSLSNGSSIIERCFSTGSVVSTGVNVGGLIGTVSGSNIEIKNSYSTGVVSGSEYCGGIAGALIASTIQNCFSISPVSGSSNIGGFVGYRYSANPGTISNSFFNTDSTVSGVGSGPSTGVEGRSTAEMTDPLIYFFGGWDNTVWYWDSDFNNAYPALAWQNPSGTPLQADVFSGGSGTSEDPYQIASAEDLNMVRYALTKYYIQTTDIDLNVSPFNTGAGWEPIGADASRFAGEFDGNGYKISNLFIDRSGSDNVGLFGLLDGATVKNVNLVDVNITGKDFVGAIAGRNFAVIQQCYSTGSVNGANYVGGITGHTMNGSITGSITRCYSFASVSGTAHVGGLIGRLFEGSIDQCYSAGAVAGSSSTGGLVGSHGGGTASSIYWDNQTSGYGGSAVGVGKTTDEMRGITASNGITDWGWDTSIWERIGHNYPTLKVMREVNLDNIGNSDFSTSDFRDIVFKSETGTITVDFEFFASTTPPDLPDGSISVGKYWDVMSLSGNTKIRLYYTADEKSQFTGTPKIYHYTGGQWVELPTEPEVDIDDLGTDFYVETTNYYSSFSPVTVGDNASPLPVELVSFEGYNTEEGVELNWETSTEVNNYGFEVQRTSVGTTHELSLQWEKIGFVEGSGNSNSPKQYTFTDEKTSEVLGNLGGLDGKLQYRLKQIDFDGKFEYSETITVESLRATNLPTEFALQQNYPNPFNPTTSIEYSVPSSEYVILKVYDVLGNEVVTLVNEQKSAGHYKVSFNAINLASGLYIYRIQVGEFNSVRKMMFIK